MSTAPPSGPAPHLSMQPFAADHPWREQAPQTTWHPLHAAEHVVQFYETDTFLCDVLGDFIGTGLAAGDACIVVATPTHRAGLDDRLLAAGLDLNAARASGQYLALDAAETLAMFLVDGSPSPGRFAAVLGATIAQAATGRPHVRIFGEMVALLWGDGQYDAALRLEALWNDLRSQHTFVLFCAYPLHNFAGVAHAQGLHDVCASHARVIPAESYTRLADADERSRAISRLQQQAQSLEAEIAERTAAEAALRSAKEELEVQVADLRRLHETSTRITSTRDVRSCSRRC